MPEATEDEPTEDRFTLRISAPLLVRIGRLIDRPELGFTSLEHFLMAGIHSFVSFKERYIQTLEARPRGARR